MLDRGGGDKTVDGRERATGFFKLCSQFTPEHSGFKIDGENTVGGDSHELPQPLLKPSLLFACPQPVNAFAEFSDRQHA